MRNRQQIIQELKQKYTLAEIGELLGVSRQRIHQILNHKYTPKRIKLTTHVKKIKGKEYEFIPNGGKWSYKLLVINKNGERMYFTDEQQAQEVITKFNL